jgi:hypothetical protein
MKKIFVTSIFLCGLIVFWGSPVFGEQWNAEQKEIIKTIQTRWEYMKQGNSEAYLDTVHDEALVWWSGEAIPLDKSNIGPRYRGWIASPSKPVSHRSKPLSIHILDNIAIVYSRFEWKAEGKSFRSFRSMTVWKKEDNKWKNIGSMSDPCDKPPYCIDIEGVTGKETYAHEAPAFSVQYPISYKKGNLWSETEVLRVRDPMRGSFVIKTEDVPEGAKLADEGKRITDAYKKFDPNLKFISSEQMNTQDGTPTTLFKMEWIWRTRAIKTLGLSIFKDKKRIGFLYHFPSERQDWGDDIEAEAMEIFKSMTFK